MKQPPKQPWYHQRKWAAIISPLSLIASYVMASLAINSGSLMQYFAAIVLLCLCINRLGHVAVVTIKGRKS